MNGFVFQSRSIDVPFVDVEAEHDRISRVGDIYRAHLSELLLAVASKISKDGLSLPVNIKLTIKRDKWEMIIFANVEEVK